MTKNQVITLFVVAVVVVFVVVYFAGEPAIAPNNEGSSAPVGEEVAPGTSLITDDGEVVTQTGEPVKLDVSPGSPEAPQQSNPVSEGQLPNSAIKLTMSASGIAPSSFEVRSGEAVTLSVTATDDQTHIFKFDDPSLNAVAVGVAPGETRAITFNAPSKGEYGFHCDVPGHAIRGENGVMIVK